jgi:hypothetical protein
VGDVVIALALMVATLATGAYLGHQLHACRYRRALQRVVAASNDPTNQHLGRALDDADELLHGPR